MAFKKTLLFFAALFSCIHGIAQQDLQLTKRIITADKAGRHSIRYGNKVLKLFLKKGGNTIQHLL